MPTRNYMIAGRQPGRIDTEIIEIVSRGTNDQLRSGLMSLPPGTPAEVGPEVLDALRRVYQDGREDRSEELLSDPDEAPSYYRGVAVPDRLRATWRSQAASYWRAGVEAACEASRKV